VKKGTVKKKFARRSSLSISSRRGAEEEKDGEEPTLEKKILRGG